jgi:two-component system, cell cycle sensor histidine kinase and response regulator CckA
MCGTPKTETVLLVEDEQTLRLAALMLLQKTGFCVIAASEGHAAVNLLRAHSDQVDIVLLDLTLPDLSGVQVFREMRRLKPDIKILLTSAYSQEIVRAHFTLEEQALFHFLHKPYRVSELVSRLRDVLA